MLSGKKCEVIATGEEGVQGRAEVWLFSYAHINS